MFKFTHNGVNSYIFVKGVEVCKLKAKDSEINSVPLFLGNVSEDFSVDNMEKTGLYGGIYDFSGDYDSIDVDDVLESSKIFNEKARYKITYRLMKQVFITLLSFG